MKILKWLLATGLTLAVLGGCFAAGILVGFRYGDFNRLPFVAGGEWTIGIYTGDNPFQLSSADGIDQPVLHPDDVTDMPARQVADPFMVYDSGTWYMFFEVLHASTEEGNIGLATSEDGLHWDYRQIVIDEDFHLSYPLVFKWQEDYYMIPESHQSGMVLLYRAENFPTEWVQAGTLLDERRVDPTFFVANDTCWLYVASPNRARAELYFATEPTGPWTSHPANPITAFDPNKACAAGRVIEYEGKRYRYAMDCDPDYGNAVRVFRIEELSSDAYREVEIADSPILSGTGSGWNADRMHHVDAHQLPDGGWIASVDGWNRIVQVGWKY